MERIDVFEENRRLREENEFLKQQIKNIEERCNTLEQELKRVNGLLAQFLNANTPSSQLPPQFKTTWNPRPLVGTKPRGKPVGSNGATKEAPKHIDAHVEIKPDVSACTKCRKRLHSQIRTRHVYEIKKIVVSVTEVTEHEGYCRTCDLTYKGVHPDIPSEGMIGYNLLAFFTELKHNFAGSYDKISTFFESLTGESFSGAAINDCVERVAKQLTPSYKEFENKLPCVPYAHSDETSWFVNGEQQWLWHFTTEDFVFLTINKSRSRNVITNFFGDQFDGVIISDCFRVYNKFASAFHKDWVHLMRKTHFEADKNKNGDITNLHKELHMMYNEINTFIDTEPTFEQRVWQSICSHQKLQRITQHNWQSKTAQNIISNWLKEYQGQWLLPIIMPNISLTNNIAERGIRSIIPTRKLLGGHRTNKGAKNFAIIESHRQTWRMQGMSPYSMLINSLKEKNCAA